MTDEKLTQRVEESSMASCSSTSSATSTTGSSTSPTGVRYVLGFMFDADHKKVLLVHKSAPKWQAGKYNGVGGKIDPGETPIEAMVREFGEETGINTDPEEWEPRLILRGAEWTVYILCAEGNIHLAKQITKKDDPWCSRVDTLPANVIPNLHWIIPFCLDKEKVCGTIMYPSLMHGTPSTTTER